MASTPQQQQQQQHVMEEKKKGMIIFATKCSIGTSNSCGIDIHLNPIEAKYIVNNTVNIKLPEDCEQWLSITKYWLIMERSSVSSNTKWKLMTYGKTTHDPLIIHLKGSSPNQTIEFDKVFSKTMKIIQLVPFYDAWYSYAGVPYNFDIIGEHPSMLTVERRLLSNYVGKKTPHATCDVLAMKFKLIPAVVNHTEKDCYEMAPVIPRANYAADDDNNNKMILHPIIHCLKDDLILPPNDIYLYDTEFDNIYYRGIFSTILCSDDIYYKQPNISLGGGLIDEDYTGRIYIIIRNTSDHETTTLHRGTKFYQVYHYNYLPYVLSEHPYNNIQHDKSVYRHTKGFGSTDKELL